MSWPAPDRRKRHFQCIGGRHHGDFVTQCGTHLIDLGDRSGVYEYHQASPVDRNAIVLVWTPNEYRTYTRGR